MKRKGFAFYLHFLQKSFLSLYLSGIAGNELPIKTRNRRKNVSSRFVRFVLRDYVFPLPTTRRNDTDKNVLLPALDRGQVRVYKYPAP